MVIGSDWRTMTFDFTGLQRDPPPGFVVLKADVTGLDLKRQRDGAIFLVRHVGKHFELSGSNPHRTGPAQFIMKTDNIGTMMKALGYPGAG